MAKKQTKVHQRGRKPPKKHSSAQALKVYWPYIPLLVLLVGGLFLNVWQPIRSHQSASTLAYATEMSRSGLLNSTNSQRANNGASALSLNEKLNAAAQSKANDMVTRNYWSHNTPDGQEPWIFIDAQGYSYTKAGENLAYGFSTSNATVIGWMNSPSHKANMLDTTFSEVGFGFTNSANFVGNGEQTVVVAMYGSPVLGASTEPAPTPTAEPAPQPVAQAPPPPAPEPQVVEEEPIVVIEDTVMPEEQSNEPITTDTPVPQDVEPQRITLLQQLTGGRAPWSAVAISAFGVTLASVWIIKHFVLVRRFVIEGEHFVAHHPILDLIVVTFIAIAVYLSQSSGIVL